MKNEKNTVTPLMVFTELPNGEFKSEITKENEKCITHYFQFPVGINFINGENTVTWVEHTYDRNDDYREIDHILKGTTFVFMFKTPNAKEAVGRMNRISDTVISWSHDGSLSYYIDKFGGRDSLEDSDFVGNPRPFKKADCDDCGHTFLHSYNFINGTCPGCQNYKDGYKEIPNLSVDEWSWNSELIQLT